jgi:hypothetical protein
MEAVHIILPIDGRSFLFERKITCLQWVFLGGESFDGYRRR